MISLREARIAMDYVTGKGVEAIAEAEGLSTQRVYQLLNKVAYRVMGFSSITHVVPYAAVFQTQLHHILDPVHRHASVNASTPEGFYLELLNEQKVKDFT